jgi:ABC-type multidrug transport system ATPase subunit
LSVLRVTEVSKSFGGRAVLSDVSFSCGPGETVVVLGENGAGKSTLLRIVAGLAEPDSGRVVLCEERIAPGAMAGRRHLGYLPDAADVFPDLTVAELVRLAVALKRARPPASALTSWRRRLGLETVDGRLRTLSFGQRKRALLLVALIGDPWLLVLDEPSSGLDPEGCALVATIVRERRAAALGTLVASNDSALVHEMGGRVHQLGPWRAAGHIR